MVAPELNIIFFAFVFVLKIWEYCFPLRRLPGSPGWFLRASILTAFQFVVVYLAVPWLQKNSFVTLFHCGEYLGIWEAPVAIALISCISYWQHRLKHRVSFLWNFFHQVHHSPVRIELLTSFYRSPLEILLNMVCLLLIMQFLLGFHLSAIFVCTVFLGLADLFYHANIRTPYFLGFLIQRPESHLLHHLRGVQAFNYGDLPCWDMLFGTFRNVRGLPPVFGFAENREQKLIALILGEPDHEKRVQRH